MTFVTTMMRQTGNRCMCNFKLEAADLNTTKTQNDNTGVKRDMAAASSPAFTQTAASRLHSSSLITLITSHFFLCAKEHANKKGQTGARKSEN